MGGFRGDRRACRDFRFLFHFASSENGEHLCVTVTGLHELVIQCHRSSNFPQLDSFSQGLLAHLFQLHSNALWHQTLQRLEKLKNLGLGLGRISLLKQYKCRRIKQSIVNHLEPPFLGGWSLVHPEITRATVPRQTSTQRTQPHIHTYALCGKKQSSIQLHTN